MKIQVEKLHTSVGDFFVYKNDNPIAESIARYGEWAGIELEFLSQFIPDDGVVLDIGGHVGFHALSFAACGENVIVHSFEAQPKLFDLLKENIDRSDYSNRIFPHHMAVSDVEDAAYISLLSLDHPFNAGAEAVSYFHEEGKVQVIASTIDSMRFGRVDLLKLDVEGGESRALNGAKDLISRERPAIFAEVNSITAAARLLEAVRSWHNYVLYYVQSAAFNPKNFLGQTYNMFGYANESAVLIVPKERGSPSPFATSVCQKIDSLDDLAELIFKCPRFGDEGKFDRDWREQILEAKRLRQFVARLESDRDNLHLELEVTRSQLKETCSELEGTRSQLKETCSELESTRSQLKETCSELEGTRSQLKETRSELESTRSNLESVQNENVIRARRYDALGRLLVRKDWYAKRRTFRGAIGRFVSRSELARTCRLLEQSGLFDRKWYKQNYPDVGASTWEPVVHYVLYGAYEGRQSCPGFDSAFYLAKNSDVYDAGENPLLHYIQHGEREGRWPNSEFDPAAYLDSHPELKAKSISPLLHAIKAGNLGTRRNAPTYRPRAPEWREFEVLAQRPKDLDSQSSIVDVIIPVYRGVDDTLACIHSVLSSTPDTSFELIVIDDCSPVPELSDALERLSELGLISLFKNVKNLGFVGTVNRGMALHADRDVVLLNSDTLVFNNWLDRLRQHALVGQVATVTPFTSNGTICSYPRFCEDNPGLLECSFDQLDLLAGRVNSGRSVEVPTGVGFCMYVSRSALNQVGYFDEETFGRGYGEENDFCMRAAGNGYSNLHALDVYVYHSGETSFAEDASKLKKKGLDALVRKHPDYLSLVKTYIERDPAKEARIRLDAARLVSNPSFTPSLCVTHSWTGGIVRYLQDRAKEMADKGEGIILAVPSDETGRAFRLMSIHGNLYTPNLPVFDIDDDPSNLISLLSDISVSCLELHSTVGWSQRIIDLVPQYARLLNVPLNVMVHDYVMVCPQINLINESGTYCGETGESQCRNCLKYNRKNPISIHPDAVDAEMLNIKEWRRRYKNMLDNADLIEAPSNDTASRIMSYFPSIKVRPNPHIDLLRERGRSVVRSYKGGTLRVVVLGAIGPHKGVDLLAACADDAFTRGLPIEFTVLGYTSRPDLEQRPNVKVMGAYKEDEVFNRLEDIGANIALLPSVWPETYCYTLSILTAGGLPVCAFDLGAPAERLRDSPGGILMPTSFMTKPERVNDTLIEAIELLCSAQEFEDV